jgi:plastocyanin
MKIKIIVLLLVFGGILISGCMENQQPSPGKNTTPAETITPGENLTPVTTETQTESASPVETETQEGNITHGENVTAGEPVGPAPGIKTTPYLLRLENNKVSSSNLEIKKGETVAWMNVQDTPRRVYTLISEDKLFNNTNLVYRRSFAYTFNETGDYKFTVVNQPRMNVSVSVAEP